MRLSFSSDLELGGPLFELLDVVFPGLRGAVRRARDQGASWESVSTPFVHIEAGRPVSHVGLIEMSMVLMGRSVRAGCIHAVATHPDHRRRGHYRRLMGEVFEYCEVRYETLLLTTDHPEYYGSFGFRLLQEHLFTARPNAPGARGGMRPLDLARPSDLALLHRILDTREPVSRVVGVEGGRTVFLFNEGSRPLHYSPDLDAVLCMEREEGRLKLFDVAAPKLPSLDALLAAVPGPVEEVAFFFSPDRFAGDASPLPHVLDHGGPSILMARGPFGPEHTPFTLPRSARA